MVVDHLAIGMGNNSPAGTPSLIDEGCWESIYIGEMPPPKHGFPWLLVGLSAAAIGIMIAKRQPN